jgi:hypothetical protein
MTDTLNADVSPGHAVLTHTHHHTDSHTHSPASHTHTVDHDGVYTVDADHTHHVDHDAVYHVDHDSSHVHHHNYPQSHKESKMSVETILPLLMQQKTSGVDPALATLLAGKDKHDGMNNWWPILLLLLLGRGRGGLLSGGEEIVGTVGGGRETRQELATDFASLETNLNMLTQDVGNVSRDVLQSNNAILSAIASEGRNVNDAICGVNQNIANSQTALTNLLYQQTIDNNNQFATVNLSAEQRANMLSRQADQNLSVLQSELCALNNNLDKTTSQIRFDVERGNAATQLEIERKSNQTNLLLERESCATRAAIAADGQATRALINSQIEAGLRTEILSLRDKLNEERERSREDRDRAEARIVINDTNTNTNTAVAAQFQAQAQLQQQQQIAQIVPVLNNISTVLAGLVQIAHATNAQIIAGNTGAVTTLGAQTATASPTNIRA